MKNLGWLFSGLVIVVALVLLYVAKQFGVGKSPSPKPSEVAVESTNPKEATGTIDNMNVPFEVLKPDQIESKRVNIKTAKGNIVIELFGDAPLAASNFIGLIDKKFYDGLSFHRREEGFVIQGGDPNGNGTGGPGYKFNDEPVTRNYKQGIVAMANSGPNSNGSQFFIMLADNPLPQNYTIFGNVIEGMEVVDKIQVGDVMEKVSIK